MRIAILAAVLAFTQTARADATWQAHEGFGVDLAVLYAPRTDHEVDAGPLFHLDTSTSRSPTWLMFGFQMGLLTGNADRIVAPLLFNARLGEREGPFARIDLGYLVTSPIDDEDDDFTWSRTYGASVGWKLGAWQLSTSALRSSAFEGTAWMFTLGRDLAYLDSVVTRTTP